MTPSGTRICEWCAGSGKLAPGRDERACSPCHGTGYLVLEPKPKPYLGAPRANPKSVKEAH